MAGHSKWKNIQGRKNAQDAKRGKIFQKIAREIYVAAKNGADPELNPALRQVLDKARSANVPNENVKRAIKRATESGAGENYDEITYEGYGPNGVAVLVYALTDNRNRTGSSVRTAFTHNGGALGERGSVAFQFERKGYIAIERADLAVDEDTMLMAVLEAGADELMTSEEVFEIYTDAADFEEVRAALEADYTLAQAELAMVPNLTIDLPQEHVAQFEKMIDALEDDDDVTEVIHNAEY
ncbi:YebC/PmpR family DNA-binding transcriptional regulator [Fundicoccus ignavus]|uniref:Probable transcriptional regulatory protein GF867_01180 n=1 Tax=Fundicoccus ignavus TaxID=2664442 RepID=A0A6I2GPM7_9LACT|nr:YebC/PmpR family DNA-binding transcriptional regulator [Fundicoccus ignavus]MRI81185.1 YebC/PmpR family DNA-binding transcriptional regulator [Fundicoccus ignavus]MRI86448.1 YebC/PmpR family DNA-binding transcriptional regulator [Fundicoccus ignavus]MRJ46188.1 YebC/PmpR family DNA-binding transcriptional regulator [Fundicoccus ignavus]